MHLYFAEVVFEPILDNIRFCIFSPLIASTFLADVHDKDVNLQYYPNRDWWSS